MTNEEQLIKGIELANNNLWGLSNFKRFVSQFLKTENDEEQWTFDYESYCLELSMLKKEVVYKYVHPCNWAVEYYGERWDINKMNKSIKSLKDIIKKN